MSEEIEVRDELQLLKDRADLMGVVYHPNIGIEALKRKINSMITGTVDDVKVEYRDRDYTQAYSASDLEKLLNPSELIKAAQLIETEQEKAARLRREAMRLVRINITCMNPNKKDWPGEIIDVGNSILGSIKKYVPFNTGEPYHVPYMVYSELANREFQSHYRVKDSQGMEINKTRMVKEFAISVLDPLTEKELKELQTKQAMSQKGEVA